MEHEIYNKIRKLKIPFIIRVIITFLLVLIGLSFIALPIPGSAVIGWLIIILGIIFILEARNIKFIKKIRKGIFYYLKNIKDKQIRKHKINDFKRHIKDILNNKK